MEGRRVDRAAIRAKLAEVLRNIQADSGLECPPLTGGTRPLDHLPKFDSKIWPVAIGMLAAALGVSIPNDINIFRDERTKQARSLDEIVGFVGRLIDAQAALAAAAA
jgi:hypothetical protein